MHALTSAPRQVALAALLLALANGGAAVAAPCPPLMVKDTLVGAFIGIPSITILEDGKQQVVFDGVGTLTDMGNALCGTTDEIYDPVTNKAYGRHVLSAENGCDEIVIWFETTSVVTTAVLDENNVPTVLYIKMEANWSIESGKGRYRGAKGGGKLYVDAEGSPTGPTTMVGIGRWAMWGEIERARRPHRWCGWWK